MSKSIAPTRRRGEQLNAESFDIDQVATDLILEHGAMILRDARRYSACLADAEDAYQRSLVIMLTQAPSTKPEELVPWLRVVVRREAAEIARERNRVMSKPLDETTDARTADEALPEEHALDTFDVEIGIEALSKLKPDQIKCLLAQADGRSYAEISDITGFSARKVARNVNEGRRAFMMRVESIESGSECTRVDELLQEIADGDEIAIDSVRTHLKNCPGCRTAVREYKDAPRHATVLFPPALLTFSTATAATSSPFEQISAAWHQGIERLNLHAHSVQQWAEVGTYKKVAAVVAITATVATGGAAVTQLESHRIGSHKSAAAAETASVPEPGRLLDEIHVAHAARTPTHRKRHPKESAAPAPKPRTAAPPQQISNDNQPIGDGSSEFLPEQR